MVGLELKWFRQLSFFNSQGTLPKPVPVALMVSSLYVLSDNGNQRGPGSASEIICVSGLLAEYAVRLIPQTDKRV